MVREGYFVVFVKPYGQTERAAWSQPYCSRVNALRELHRSRRMFRNWTFTLEVV